MTLGTNKLIGQDMNRLAFEVNNILNHEAKYGVIPPLWDGLSSERIADILMQ